ncbi:MAG: glycine--tRNA ligase subunit beta [Fimbriimonadales bacterium]|nr:glycine--tRNA ligase subunit beta [Fimbriimonadales bacterium]
MSHSATLLFEIGCEEMPAAFMRGALEQLHALLEEALRELRLPFGSIATYGTPRRLVALAHGVATHQTPEERTVRGPARRVCFDAEGKPTQALLGFARSQGVEPEQVQFMETPQGEYAFVQVRDAGQPATTVLAERLPALIRQMTFPKTLRWGAHQLRFGRPIRWIVALLGDQPIEFEIDGIRSGRFSRGHRFQSPQPFEVRSPDEFPQQLREAHVMADPEERKAFIREEAIRLAREVDAQPLLSDDLLEENTFLVEYPHLLRGAFPEAFLRLPAPVLISAMKKHEKFFPLVDSSGHLLPGFISVYNNGNPDYVREGNEWVLVARFNDASFFFEEDLKQPLEAFVQGLERMLFQQKLGTLMDKTRRLQRLAERLARALDWDRPTEECLQRAALLCKADLATQMVMEFPDLQGVIGEEYALRAGEPLCVARAIAEHYQPRYAGDALPQTPVGRALAVLDRVDTLVGYVGLGYLPKGSSDPFGLRRAATGVVEILAEEPDYPTLSELVQVAHDEYRADGITLKPLAALQPDLRTLFYSRIEALLEEQGIRYDLIRATIGGGWDDSVYGFVQRARLLQAHQATPMFHGLAQTATRPANILAAARKKNINTVASLSEVDPTLFEHEVESRLYHALQSLTPQIEALYYKHDYEAIYTRLQELDEPVNRLFDHVMVMTEDESLRRNRLNLLACANRLYLALADFPEVVEA